MDPTISQYSRKLKLVLDAFLEPEYQIRNESYLNNLLTHLAGKENPDLSVELLQLPVVTDWVPRGLICWENNALSSLSVNTFALNLTALLSKNEAMFSNYNSINVYSRLFKIFNTRAHNIAPTIKLAYIKLLSSFLEHKSGIEWIISNDIWRDCLNFCLENQTIYIIREGHYFIYKLLTKAVDVNLDFVNKVMEEILSKFNQQFCTQLFPEIEDEILTKQINPTLKLILSMFENLLNGDLFVERDFRVAQLLISHHHLEVAIDKIIILAKSGSELLFELYNILMHIYIFELFLITKTELFTKTNVCNAGQKMFNILSNLINSGEVTNVVKLTAVADTLWQYTDGRKPIVEPKEDKEPFLFEMQTLIFLAVPIFGVTMNHCRCNYVEMEEDDVREAFLIKILKKMCVDTIRTCYSWRSSIMQHPESAFDIGKLALTYLMKFIKRYDKDRAVIVLQILIYSLTDISQEIAEKPTSIEVFKNNISYFMLLLESMEAYISNFDITWRESVETTSVTSCVIDFVKLPVWPARVVVRALKVVKISIAKFLAPNLALLVEEANDTAMECLGSMITGKLCDTEWEVRDSALELVTTIANISNRKYPLYQTMLMDLEIIKLVVTMAESDSEAFVRASAIKCLQEMIQVKVFWCQFLAHHKIPEKMMGILKNETEAIVRTEAASLMRHIHEYQSFPNELMNEIYEAMAFAVTSDLHWEVKLNALDFWDKVILNHLQDQGFIDGKFPNVTFSKENRKIVTLTEKEIKSRLAKVLRQLCTNGCLAVLINAIEDDCDLEVNKKSLATTKMIAKILNKYNMRSAHETSAQPQSPTTIGVASPTGSSNMEFSDSIIDQIINSNDISLLANVYKPDYQTSNGVPTRLRVISPEMFLTFIETDLDCVVTEKTKWLNNMDSLNSLLDDMLKTYEGNINSMDCY